MVPVIGKMVRPPLSSEFEIPPVLDEILLDCLRKRPQDRPASVADLLDRLDRLETDAAWTPARAARWWDVHHPAGSPDPEETPGLVPRVDRVAVHPETKTLRKTPPGEAEEKPRS